MTVTREQIEDLVLRIQSEFLDHPTLALTQAAAERRFDINDVTCAGVLGALVDGRVLTERATVPIAGTFHITFSERPES